jgi:hypothetical protein
MHPPSLSVSMNEGAHVIRFCFFIKGVHCNWKAALNQSQSLDHRRRDKQNEKSVGLQKEKEKRISKIARCTTSVHVVEGSGDINTEIRHY